MTVENTALRTTQNGDGVTTSFPFGFQISQLSDVKVDIVTASGVKTTLSSGYQVMLNDPSDLKGGGYIIYPYPITGPKLAAGETIIIYRESDLLQSLDLTNTGPFLAENIEAAIDKVVMVLQETSNKVNKFKNVYIQSDAPEVDTGDMVLWIKPDSGSFSLIIKVGD